MNPVNRAAGDVTGREGFIAPSPEELRLDENDTRKARVRRT
ncbi:MAG: hypothetical protein V3V52_08075 [Candidatus Adiutricales bacterium]